MYNAPRVVGETAGEAAAQWRARTALEPSADASSSRGADDADDAEVLADAMTRFRLVADAEHTLRRVELDDLRFVRGRVEDQWPADVLEARRGGVHGGRAVGARPTPVFNKLKAPVMQVVNEAKRSKLSVRIKAKGGRASKAGAELRQGLYRAIETDCRANEARFWALERAAKCGRGYYRVTTDYANDGDWDQDILIERILNQHSVYLDPYHQRPDGSDARWAFIVQDYARDEFRRKYPTARVTDGDVVDGIMAGAEGLESLGDHAPSWVSGERVRVAEYWYTTYRTRYRIFMPGPDGVSGVPAWEDEVDAAVVALARARAEVRRRAVEVPTVHWCLITALDILDRRVWPGRFLPIVQVVAGEENVDGERSYEGVVRPAKDAARLYNYMRAKQIETVGLSTLPPYVVAEGQLSGYEQEWQEANRRAFPYLTYRPLSHDGVAVPPPQANVAEPAIQAVTLATREADADIQAMTMRHDPVLGKFDPQRQSGRAIRELKDAAVTGSSHFLDNLASVSMAHEARIVLDLMPHIYDRPGRVVRLLGDDELREQSVTLGAPMVGESQPAAAGAVYALDGADEYQVVVSVGPSTQTQRDDNAAVVQSLMETVPAVAPMVADVWAEMLDGPMSDKLVTRLRKINPQLAGDEQAAGLPPEVAAHVLQLQQQVQQMGQALQQAQQEIATRQQAQQLEHMARQQQQQQELAAKVQIAQIDAASRERVAASEVEGRLAVARLAGGNKINIAELDHESAMALQVSDQRHTAEVAMVRTRPVVPLDAPNPGVGGAVRREP
jgi:hypothetical protein